MKGSPTLRRKLRRNSTEAEKLLWQHLRDRRLGGFKFRRQHSAAPYVTDFYCAEKHLVLEVDGSGHFEPQKQLDDEVRPADLNRDGVAVLRFTNLEVLHQLEAVLETIASVLRSAPSPRPSPRSAGRGGSLS
jgi:adenine-specific DNA-methyltransferase